MKNGMRRWVGFLLAAALCVCLLPATGALAAGEAFTVVPAEGAEQSYETLPAAIAAAEAGSTIRLNANVTASDATALPAGVTLALGAYTLTVPEGASLDLSAGTAIAAGGKLVIGGSEQYSAEPAKRLSGTAVQLLSTGAYGAISVPSGSEFEGKTIYAAPNMEKSMSLNLNDMIVINCYLSDPGHNYTAASFAMVDGKKVLMTAEGTDWYLPVRESAAKEMIRENDVQMVAVDGSGAYHLAVPNTLSIRGYAEELLAGVDWETEKEAKLGRAMITMLNYGAQAQQFFHYEEADLANKNLTAADQARQVYTAANITEHRSDVRSISDAQSLYYGSSCVLGSSLALRFYLNLPESRADREDLSFKIDYKNYRGSRVTVTKTFSELTATNMDGVYYLETPGMAAADVKTEVTLTVLKDASGIATVKDTVASYCARVYDTQEEAHALSDAVMFYGLSARAYFYKSVPSAGENELPIA